MKALYYIGNQTMELREIQKPTPTDGQYLVEVKANGICGSDFEGYLGKTGRRTAPMIMGHEFSGKIVSAPSTGKFSVGDNVIVFPKPYCGECDLCKEGMVNLCPEGVCMGVLEEDGSMTEYVAVEERYLYSFENISYNEATFAEPLAVAYRSVFKISDNEIQDAKYILVIGAGTIGLLILALLKHRGVKHIIVSDTSQYRLDIAQRMGANDIINPENENFLKTINSITKDRGCDVSFEAVGIPPTALNSLESLKIGGSAIWVGNAAKLVSVPMQAIVTKELKIEGNYVYGEQDFIESINLLSNKKINIKPLITNRYDLKDGVQAFKDLEKNHDGKMIKVILEN